MKVKVGHPGTIVDYLGVIRIPRVSGLIGLVSVNIGWLNIDIFLKLKRCFSLLICGVFFVSIS